MGPDLQVFQEEFFQSSVCGKFLTFVLLLRDFATGSSLTPGSAVSGSSCPVRDPPVGSFSPRRWCGRRPARAAAGCISLS